MDGKIQGKFVEFGKIWERKVKENSKIISKTFRDNNILKSACRYHCGNIYNFELRKIAFAAQIFTLANSLPDIKDKAISRRVPF